MSAKMNEKRMQELLKALVEEIANMSETEMEDCMDFEDYSDLHMTFVQTFEEVGVLTDNKGLVLSLLDRTKFHITIQQAR